MKQKAAVWLIVGALVAFAAWVAWSPQDQDYAPNQDQVKIGEVKEQAVRTHTPEEVKIDEAKAKAAWNDKVVSYQLCTVQNEVVKHYHDRLHAEGKAVPHPIATPACRDPGPFAYVVNNEPQPLEGSGAHSPAETATQAPSSSIPASEQGR